MDWQKSLLQKDKMYYFKYREFSGIFTINDHTSDNSAQINIKFTFMYINISYYPILYIFIIYIYIYIYKHCAFCLFQHCRNTHIHMLATLVSHSHNLFQLDITWSLSLVETAYPIVNMIQVINKEARAT